MTRPGWRRARAVVLATLFGLFTAESVALPACPMHEGQAVPSSAAHPGAPTVAAPEAGADVGSHAGSHTGSYAGSHELGASSDDALGHGGHANHDTGPGGACDCLGACAGAPAVALSPTRFRDVAVVRYAPARRPASIGVAPVAAPPHRLPFAIPPPSAITNL